MKVDQYSFVFMYVCVFMGFCVYMTLIYTTIVCVYCALCICVSFVHPIYSKLHHMHGLKMKKIYYYDSVPYVTNYTKNLKNLKKFVLNIGYEGLSLEAAWGRTKLHGV